MTENVYPNSDIDKLYVDKKSGDKELRSIKIMFESRLVGLRPYMTRSKNRNKILLTSTTWCRSKISISSTYKEKQPRCYNWK